MSLPPINPIDFTAEELNVLRKSARKNEYHQECFNFVMSLGGRQWLDFSKKEKNWLLGIKQEVKVLLEDSDG